MLKAYYKISKFSNHFKYKIKGRKYLSRSFVCNLSRWFYSYFGYSTYTYPLVDVSGTNRTNSSSGILIGNNTFVSGYGDCVYTSYISENLATSGDFFGIVLGIGTAAVIPTDDNMQTRIMHGTSSGQLIHFGTFANPVITVSSPNLSISLGRLFLNSSGGDIVVGESGLYSGGISVGSTPYAVCMARDVLSSTVTVSDSEYLLVTYTIQVTA